jgi:hypothetical protein
MLINKIYVKLLVIDPFKYVIILDIINVKEGTKQLAAVLMNKVTVSNYRICMYVSINR